MRSYGRGIARKAAFTKKCCCENPRWSGDHVEVNGNTHEITYVLNCANCGAYWGTKSSKARKCWENKMDSVPMSFYGYGGRDKDKRTVRELFRELDEKRLEYLKGIAEHRRATAVEAIKAAEEAEKAAEKFATEMGKQGGI